MKKCVVVAEKESCCGCGACFQACPKDAVKMEYDEEGFLYPKIQEQACVECGLCRKVCPVLNTKARQDYQEAFAVRSNREAVLKTSTSGGASCELAGSMLSQGGIVFGVCYNEKFEVLHRELTDQDSLSHIQGSKYVQSDTNTCYRKAKRHLDDGKTVFFTGTPCQIAGLYSYLGRDYENLYTQDCICHGVPSPGLWKKYVREQKLADKALDVSFRYKENGVGWGTKGYYFSILYKRGTRKSCNKNEFCGLFSQNFSLRPICYCCPFKSGYGVSDLTCADLWGIEDILPNVTDDKGMSLCIVHTEKGKRLLEQAKDFLDIRPISYQSAVEHNGMAVSSVKRPEKRDDFFRNSKKMSTKRLAKKYLPKDPVILRIKKKLYPIKQAIIKNR